MYNIGEENKLMLICDILFPSRVLSLCSDNIGKYIGKCSTYGSVSWLPFLWMLLVVLGIVGIRFIRGI